MAVLLETSVGDLTIDLMTEDRPQGEISVYHTSNV